jgi:UDP-N-acetylglucosamine/UDP-N-acetylgalactosamine 4-epimerase
MTSAFETLRQNFGQHRWVVTGVAGFIGSHLLEDLLRLNQEVVGVDNFATGYQKNLNLVHEAVGPAVWKRFTFIEGDCCTPSVCEKATKGASFVLHQAALGSVPRSIEDPLSSNRANVDGFVTMLEASRAAGVKRFVYASSSSVYGDSAELPKKEEHKGNLLSPYAATKAINELYATVWGRVYGVQCIGLRYFNVFGARQDPNGAYAAVIPRWVDAVLSGKSCVINGDGKNSRDFCYVKNVVQANLLSAFAPEEAVGQVFNIAVGEQTTLLQLHDQIWDAALGLERVKERVAPTFGEFRRGDILHSHADISKAKKLLGYVPTVRIGEGIKELVSSWPMGKA